MTPEGSNCNAVNVRHPLTSEIIKTAKQSTEFVEDVWTCDWGLGHDDIAMIRAMCMAVAMRCEVERAGPPVSYDLWIEHSAGIE